MRAESLAICVDIGGSSTKAGLLDAGGEISHLDSIPTKPDAESFYDRLIRLIAQTQARAESENMEVPPRLGVAVAGFLDGSLDHLVYNSNLIWLENFPLRKRLQAQFPNFRVELEIDSNAATMAEYHFGSGQGSRRFLCLTAGTGLGVGMTIDGEPLRFAYGCMGDAGHTIVLRNGPLCTCGGRGCAEVMVSANFLAARYRSLLGAQAEVSLREVIEAAHAGEQAAKSVLTDAGEWLGVAMASLANTFFPDCIALAGGLSAAGDIVLASAERVFRETACVFAQSQITVSRAALGATATLAGAAWPFWKRKNTLLHGEPVSR